MILKFSQFINEGGNIFKGKTDVIPKGYIDMTLQKYYEELGKIFPKKRSVFTKFVPVGSVGKKDFSGDIDLAIDAKEFFKTKDVSIEDLEDWNISIKQFNPVFEKMKKAARTATESNIMWKAFLYCIGEYINENSELLTIESKKTTNGNMFSLFPQFNPDGEMQSIGVQIDWMVGNLDWLLFSYYSDAPIENVKGLHRTQLMLAMFDAKNYSFNHVTGVKNKLTGETEADNAKSATVLLSNLYNKPLSDKTLQNYISLHKYLKDNTNDNDYNKVIDIYLKILDKTRCDIPFDLQDYWISNQTKLNLTGKFLPETSKLIKYT